MTEKDLPTGSPVRNFSAPDSVVRAGKAALVTTAVLLLLEWISSERFTWPNALGIGVWVGAVLGALSLVAGRVDRRKPVWRQLVVLALTAGLASSLTYTFFFAIVTALPGVFDGAPERSLSAAAIVGFFDGDALFGFWALLVELPRRMEAQQRLEQERHVLHREAELARIRTATMESHRSHHAVREEVRWLRAFARILEARHVGRLAFEWDIDRSVEDCALPVFLLQPLIENAVHHGALRRPEPGRVALSIAGDGDRLRCAVEDDGPGFDAAAARPSGRGLELVRRRLAIESPETSLRIDSRSGETRVELSLPKRIA